MHCEANKMKRTQYTLWPGQRGMERKSRLMDRKKSYYMILCTHAQLWHRIKSRIWHYQCLWLTTMSRKNAQPFSTSHLRINLMLLFVYPGLLHTHETSIKKKPKHATHLITARWWRRRQRWRRFTTDVQARTILLFRLLTHSRARPYPRALVLLTHLSARREIF